MYHSWTVHPSITILRIGQLPNDHFIESETNSEHTLLIYQGLH